MNPTTIGFLLFPGVLQLDFTGPYGVLAAGPNVSLHCIWKDTQPILSSDKLLLTPTTTMENCPLLDVLVVPGGGGADALLNDQAVLAFLREQARTARYIASVCTGSLLLGAAGLLAGYQATTHWMSWNLLEQFGAIPVKSRLVRDKNRLTAAGVTSGIDMALSLAALLWGEEEAQRIQLSMEYAPSPPFAAGTPETAPPAVIAKQLAMTAARQRAREEAVARAALRLRQ